MKTRPAQPFRTGVSAGMVARVGRSQRIQATGDIFHVTARGVRRGPIFIEDIDFEIYIRLLKQAVERHGWKVQSFCLMPNHVHLVVRLLEPTLSRGVHRLHGMYARRFNERHGYAGHVFDARFGANLITSEEQHLETIRYVALNPVRAGICERPEDWQWSSHRAIAGLSHRWVPVAVEEVRELFGPPPQGARRYRDFVAAGIRRVA